MMSASKTIASIGFLGLLCGVSFRYGSSFLGTGRAKQRAEQTQKSADLGVEPPPPSLAPLLADPELQQALQKALGDPKVQEKLKESISEAGQMAMQDAEVREALQHVMQVKQISQDPETKQQAKEVAQKAAEVMAVAGQDAMKDPKVQAAVEHAQKLTKQAKILVSDPQAAQRAGELSEQARETVVAALKQANDPKVQAKAEEYLIKLASDPATQVQAMTAVQAQLAKAGQDAMQEPAVQQALQRAMQMQVQAQALAKFASDPEMQQKAAELASEAAMKIGQVAMAQPKAVELLSHLQALKATTDRKQELMALVTKMQNQIGPKLMNDPAVKAAIDQAVKVLTSDPAMKSAIEEMSAGNFGGVATGTANQIASDPEKVKQVQIVLRQQVHSAIAVANDPAVQEKVWPEAGLMTHFNSGSHRMAAWSASAVTMLFSLLFSA